jgi:threonyl-tRNA synthetase
VDELRQRGVRADLDHAARSMKAQFKYANKLGVKKVVVIAGDELAKGVVKLRDMAKSEETEVAREEIAQRMVESIRVCFQKHKPRKKMRKYAVSQIKPKGKQGGNVEYNP